MGNLKWFSGGEDRSKEAITIISELQNDTTNELLREALDNYKKELEEGESSVPFILSRMNIDISQVFMENDIVLSQSQTRRMKDLSAISEIRYGY